MSSSTSSSELHALVPRPAPAARPKERAPAVRVVRGDARARKILAVLAILAAGLEVVTRLALVPSSKDLRRFAAYPAEARALAAAPGIRLAFVGNSLTERGVDLAILRESLREEASIEAGAGMFVAHGSHLNTWRSITEHEMWKQGISPDLLILTFYERGLEDHQPLEVGRLAQFFSDRHDWSELFRHDLTTLEQRADLVVSSAWATFAVRERIKERAFGLLPGYKAYVDRGNAITLRHRKPGADKESPATHDALNRFLARAKESHTEVLFVAFPSRSPDPTAEVPYDVPAETTRIIADAGMRYLDLRRMPELSPEHYDDDIHLNEAGRRIYTQRFARELAAILGQRSSRLSRSR
ncbi:MAG: hypothetical protein QM820_30305 [Minicystis sp.]